MSLHYSLPLDQEVRPVLAVLLGLTSMVALVVVAPVTNTAALAGGLDRNTGNRSKFILQIRSFTNLKVIAVCDINARPLDQGQCL